MGSENSDGQAESVLNGVREYLHPAENQTSELRWIAGRVLNERELIVLYNRPSQLPTIWGLFIELDLLEEFMPEGGSLVQEAISELEESSRGYLAPRADWAVGLVPEPHLVVWRNISLFDGIVPYQPSSPSLDTDGDGPAVFSF